MRSNSSPRKRSPRSVERRAPSARRTPRSKRERQIEPQDLVAAARERVVEPERQRDTRAKGDVFADLHVKAHSGLDRRGVFDLTRGIGLYDGGVREPVLVAQIETRRQEREDEVPAVQAHGQIEVRRLFALW